MAYAFVDVPDEFQAEFHVMFGNWLSEKLVGGQEQPASDVEQVLESGLLKTPWDASDAAVKAATWMLQSVAEKAHPLVQLFVDEPELRATQDEIADRLGWSSGTVKSHRNLFGKQAWRAGEWTNPISSERTPDGERVYFMRPETVETLVKAGM